MRKKGPRRANCGIRIVDWGSAAYAQATGYVSNRLDVSANHIFPWRVPMPGSIRTYDQAAMDAKDRLFPVLEEVFGR